MAYTEEEKRKNIGVVAQTLVDEGLLDKEDAEEFKRTEPKLAIPGLDKVLKALGAAEANEKTKAAIGTLRQALLEGDKASMTVQKAAAELLGLQAQVKRQQAEADAIARKNSIALAKVGLGHGQGPDGKDLISLEKAEEEGTLRDRLEQLRDVEGGLTTEDITKLSASGKALLDWEKGQATYKAEVKQAVETAKGTQAEAERKRVEAAALAAELAPRLALVGIGDGAGQISIDQAIADNSFMKRITALVGKTDPATGKKLTQADVDKILPFAKLSLENYQIQETMAATITQKNADAAMSVIALNMTRSLVGDGTHGVNLENMRGMVRNSLNGGGGLGSLKIADAEAPAASNQRAQRSAGPAGPVTST